MKARNAQFGDVATDAATSGYESDDHCFLTVQEVARLLPVPVSWVYGRVRERCTEPLLGYRVGKYWRFREQEVVAWVKRHERRAHDA
jgi:excisionase family DNA binding protein